MNKTRKTTGRATVRKPMVICVLALASLALFLALVFEDFGELAAAEWSELPLGLIARYALAMGMGGALAGYVLYGMFGKSGILGWLVAIAGGVLVATFSGILGSAIGLAPDLLTDGFQARDAVAIAAGALVLPLALLGWPILVPIWGVLVALAHVVALRGK
jgi:hypothetical protein